MSFNELEESIKKLDDLAEVPQLRARIKELEAELHRCNQKYEQKESAWMKENRELKQENDTKDAENRKLADLRIIYNKDSLSLRDVDKLVNLRFTSENEKKNALRVERLVGTLLPSRVAEEIKRYPHCAPETKRIIEKVADTIIGTRVGLFVSNFFT